MSDIADELPHGDPQQQFDQLIAVSNELARAVRRYYEQMIEQGFDEAAALELAVSYQQTVLVTAST
jgi:hypothetical protein